MKEKHSLLADRIKKLRDVKLDHMLLPSYLLYHWLSQNRYRHILKIFRLISNPIRTSATADSIARKIDSAVRNILPDELSFPFTGGSLCEPEDITDVGGDVIVGVGLGIRVATDVEVGTFILDVGLG